MARSKSWKCSAGGCAPLSSPARPARGGRRHRNEAAPLPPSIRRAPDAEDRDRYQTVYAAHDGSVAAPTAGLHFTTELLARLHEQGAFVTALHLHVGRGTFKPVETEELGGHVMHPEAYEIADGAANWVNRVKGAGHGVWAVGTTVVRALESSVDANGEVRAG